MDYFLFAALFTLAVLIVIVPKPQRFIDADGTLIAFATQPSRVAADGQGRNSPFTQALLKNLTTPGVELRTLMTRVRADVVAATGGSQRPEVWNSLIGEFAFMPVQ